MFYLFSIRKHPHSHNVSVFTNEPRLEQVTEGAQIDNYYRGGTVLGSGCGGNGGPLLAAHAHPEQVPALGGLAATAHDIQRKNAP